jgi:hypothetical protein
MPDSCFNHERADELLISSKKAVANISSDILRTSSPAEIIFSGGGNAKTSNRECMIIFV